MRNRQTYSCPRPFAFLLFVFVILAFTISLINPLFESTDEIRHYRYLRHLVVNHRLPVQGQEETLSQSHHPPLYYALSALASGWIPSPHTPEYEHPINPFWSHRNFQVGVDNKLQYWHGPAERFPFREGYLAAMIPRWVNVLLGASTVTLTYWIGRRLWPTTPVLALAAASMLAFNPQFIYLSAAMNNDIVATVASAAVLLGCIDLVRRPSSITRSRVLIGLIYGLALLSKLHLAALGAIIALALWIETRTEAARRKRLRRWIEGMAIVLTIAGLVAGWWFVRNRLLYGDFTGMSVVNTLWAGRPANENWWALRAGLPYLWSSLWGRFGYGQIPLPEWLYTAISILCGIGLLGHLSIVIRHPSQTNKSAGQPSTDRPAPFTILHSPLFLFLLTVLVFFVIVTYYILIQPAGAMGRFLFPAFPAFAVLVVSGYERILRVVDRTPVQHRTRSRESILSYILIAGLGLFALTALGGYLWPAVRYPERARIPPAPLDVQIDDVARILAVQAAPTQALPGDAVLVRVTWEPLRTTERPYNVYIHLIDDSDVLVAQRDTWPGLGRAPTTDWRSGQPFEDTYRVDLPEATYTPNTITVRVGLYEAEWGRLPVYRDGQPIGDGLDGGAVAILSPEGDWPNSQFTNFGNEIALVGYELAPRVLAAGETVSLTLYWQPLRPPAQEYGVFAQVLGQDFQVWGSHDGAGPVWTAGDVITETRFITLRPDTPPASYPIQVGLFHSEGRLPVIGPDGFHYLDERALLGPLRVTP